MIIIATPWLMQLLLGTCRVPNSSNMKLTVFNMVEMNIFFSDTMKTWALGELDFVFFL